MSAIETKNQPLPGEPLHFHEDIAEKARQSLIKRGLVYIVRPDKIQSYANNGLQQITVPEELAQLLGPLAAPDNSLHVDLEKVYPAIVHGEDTGFTTHSLQKLREGIRNHFHLATQFSLHPAGREWLSRNIGSQDQERLEFNHFTAQNVADRLPLGPGSLVRVDVLRQQDGRIRSCDPNLVPMGMAFHYGYSQAIETETGISLPGYNRYFQELAALSTSPDGFVGILTGLHYPNWPSHFFMAKEVTEKTGHAVHIVPAHCLLPDGSIDLDLLRRFYHHMGSSELESRTPPNSKIIPNHLIRYSRETSQFHPDTHVVNYPGCRVTESQIWAGLASLPGFENIARSLDISGVNIDSLVEATTPTLLCRMGPDGLQVARSISVGNGAIEVEWTPAKASIDTFTRVTNQIGSAEKQNERSWFVKSPSTSGKKGVTFTNDGRPDKAPELISKVTKNIPAGEIFVVQPKIRSTVAIDGVEKRFKGDVFLTGSELDFSGADGMITPISQRSAHGGSETMTCLVSIG